MGLFGLFLLCFFAAAFSPAYASDPVVLEPEVVTGSRIYESLEEVPAATYVVTSEDIEKSGATKLSELLTNIPGIFSRSRAGNMQDEFVEMRGLTTEVLILIDGVPYYKTSHLANASAVDLRSIAISNIERIEIVKGASSALYGSMAAGGVVNIITKKPEGKGYHILGEAGSDEWRKGSVAAWTTSGDFGVRAWFSKAKEGESPLLYYSNYMGTYEDKNLDYDNKAGGICLIKGPFVLNSSWGQYDSRWTYGGYNQSQDNDYKRFSLRWGDSANRVILYYDDDNKHLVQSGTYGFSKTFVDDESWGLEYSHKVIWAESLISWGFGFRDENMTYDYNNKSTYYDRSRKNYAPFIEISQPLGELLLNVGLRYEIWDQDNGKDYNELNPKLSLSYQALNGTTWYLSAGRFFAMPSLYESSYYSLPATEPNADLKPEKGYSYELGCKGKDEFGSWNIETFYLNMEDKIDIASDWSTYLNIDKFHSWSVEASRKWRVSSLWSVGIGATWMKAEEKEGGEWIKGGTPEWDIDATLIYENGPLFGQVTLHYLGNREDEREGIGSLSQGDVTTVDMTIQHTTGSSIVKISAYNLFDKNYYLQDYTKYGTTTRYYGPERRVYLTWEYAF